MNARQAVARALRDARFRSFFRNPVHVVAVGKAASAMASAFIAHSPTTVESILAIGTHRVPDMPASVDWREAAHPFADVRSVAAAERALGIAHGVADDESLVLLLSGGASALMSLPIDEVSLEEKQQTIRRMMLAGADITALNTVRKHLSRVKGGRLAAACQGATLTLAVSDVVGDDLSVIGSGPGVADPTTWHEAADALERYAPDHAVIRAIASRGLAGELPETPKPGDATMARTEGAVIASRRQALAAAAAAAEALGYRVITLGDDLTGEARVVAGEWLAIAREKIAEVDEAVCVLSAGETTVRVVGQGRGGRNQEFVLALANALASVKREVVVASVGTDGVDGPTDAAGALADRTTRDRASVLGADPRAALEDNDAYPFFALLGDLIHLGRTDTNVGDVQVLLAR